VVKQKKFTFLTFSAYRIILFGGLLGIVLCAHLLGPMMWRHYVGTGNAFHYQSGTLAVHYLDVGQGDAIIIQLPDGKVVVMDSGSERYYNRVKTYLTTRVLKGSNKTIDYVIATHSHDDHIGGFAQLLEDFEVDTVFRPHNKSLDEPDVRAAGPIADTQVYQDFIDAVYTHTDFDNIHLIEIGAKIECVLDTYLLYFHTPKLDFVGRLSPTEFSDFNDISPIISLQYKTPHKDYMFIFTGDAGVGTEIEFRMCEYAQSIVFTDFEVYLKIGHHGSHNSTSPDFLDFISPNVAIISVGMRNLHRHPRGEVFTNLEKVGVGAEDIFETRLHGNIALVTDGATDRLFFAFDNEVNLSFVFVIFVPILFFICFTNFKIVNKKL